ncbi:hypothetical protein ACO22_00297 [Paracoccidioides brasiliensis]|nr:hypothetical protein ACO22_00297 [Paracoccidioides brasiliensis]
MPEIFDVLKMDSLYDETTQPQTVLWESTTVVCGSNLTVPSGRGINSRWRNQTNQQALIDEAKRGLAMSWRSKLTVLRRHIIVFLIITFIVISLCYLHITSNQSFSHALRTTGRFTLSFSKISQTSSISQQTEESSEEEPWPSFQPPPDPLPTPDYRPGVPKPPGSNYSRALIIPRLKSEFVSWISELKDVEPFVYVVDDPSSSVHSPINKGHEVMVYLTYLIDNYDNLPDIMIFMHSHRKSWHNEELLDFDAVLHVNSLSNEHVTRQGYVNLRCHWQPGCPDWMHPRDTLEDAIKQEQIFISRSWEELFPRVELPQVLSQPCCAQFALTRERARAIPRSRYVFFRDWMLRTELSDFISGRVWEYLWQVVFAGQHVLCPAEHVCYCDAYGLCFGGVPGLDRYKDLVRQKSEKEMELDKLWKEMGGVKGAMKEDNLTQEMVDRVRALGGEIRGMKKEIAEVVELAKERGKDPRVRAEEAGRMWKEGDGF